MKALNVSVSVLPLLPAQEDNSRRVVLRLVLFQKVGHGSKLVPGYSILLDFLKK